MNTKLEVPAYLEMEDGIFVSAQDATVAQWRIAKRIEKDTSRRLMISRAIKLAKANGTLDHEVLISVAVVKAAVPTLKVRHTDHGTFGGWNKDGTPYFKPKLLIVD